MRCLMQFLILSILLLTFAASLGRCTTTTEPQVAAPLENFSGIASDSNNAPNAPPLTLTNDRMKILVEQEIVPQLLPVAPSSITKLSWGSFRMHELGTVVTPTQIRERPRVNFNVHANRLYTVSLMDPDAPSRAEPIYGQWIHWLVVNVPGRDIARGDTIVEYVGAAPPEGSGQHRYILQVHEQSKRISTENQVKISRTQGSGRSKWNMERFIQNHDHAAKLVSTNFFLAEFDSSVPEIYKTLVD